MSFYIQYPLGQEWKFSAQRTRHMLVTAIDMLLDIFEKEPDYKHFHLDSQTLPIQDYLEINPEKKEILKKYISEESLLWVRGFVCRMSFAWVESLL